MTQNPEIQPEQLLRLCVGATIPELPGLVLFGGSTNSAIRAGGLIDNLEIRDDGAIGPDIFGCPTRNPVAQPAGQVLSPSGSGKTVVGEPGLAVK
jgi:hypothetical protein